MTTTEELISHPHQVLCDRDLGPDTVPWTREQMLVEVRDVTADEAALIVADEPTSVIESVSGVLWPTTDLDDTVVIEAAEEISDLPLRRGRHRRPSLWQRAMAWLDERWLLVVLLLSTHTATAITAALAVAGGVRPLLAGAAGVGFAAWALVAWRDHRHASPVRPAAAGTGGAR